MRTILPSLLLILLTRPAPALEPGAQLELTIRTIPQEEQTKINGKYRVGESGGVRLPNLKTPVNAKGLNTEQFARAAEAAYQKEGIFRQPTIEVEVTQGGDQGGPALVSIAGQVRRAGEATYRKGMTVLQAIDAAGGRNDYGGRNVLLIRNGHQFCLDFQNLKHKSIRLLPDDSLQVEQKGVIDSWKGNEATIAPLIK